MVHPPWPLGLGIAHTAHQIPGPTIQKHLSEENVIFVASKRKQETTRGFDSMIRHDDSTRMHDTMKRHDATARRFDTMIRVKTSFRKCVPSLLCIVSLGHDDPNENMFVRPENVTTR